MAEIKAEQNTQEKVMFAMRNEPGVRATTDWLKRELEEINRKWPTLSGDDLIRLQGKAQHIWRLLDAIETAPRGSVIPELTGGKNG